MVTGKLVTMVKLIRNHIGSYVLCKQINNVYMSFKTIQPIIRQSTLTQRMKFEIDILI